MTPEERKRHEQRKNSTQDKRSLNMMTGMKNKLENNIQGAVLHGVELA